MPEIVRIDNPFRRSQRNIIPAKAGETVGDICRRETYGNPRFDCEYITAINGSVIEASDRDSRRLQEGEFLLVVPKVAGGDDTGKSILNAIAFLAVIAIAPWAAGMANILTFGATWAYPLYYVAIVAAGGMLINSLQPHPKKPSSGFLDDEQSQSFGWSPTTVQRQGIAIPRFYGLNKMFGNVVAAHTEKESDTWEMTTITEIFYYDRWGERTLKKGLSNYTTTSTSKSLTSFDPRKVNLYALFCLGIGPMREPVVADSLKLNDQNVENLDSVYYESRPGDITQQPVSYFNQTKLEVVVGRLVVNGTPVTYTTSNGNFNDLEIELAFPRGLYDASGGDLANNTVAITVEIKKTTSSTWTALASSANITDNVGDKVIQTYTTVDTFAVEYGSNYDIRVTKETAERDDIKYGDDLHLDKVREIIDRQFTYPRRALVGIKALATDQLSGSIRFSCLSRGLYVRTYDGASWNIEYSNNPAWVIHDILTQPVYTGSHSPWLDLKLLLNFEGADAATSMVDSSPKGHDVTFGNDAQIDTAKFVFGAASGLLDGVDDYWQIAQDYESFDLWDNLVENWTLDFEIQMGDHAGTEGIAGQYIDANNFWHVKHIDTSGLDLLLRVNGTYIINLTGVGEITDTDWHHIAVCKVEDEVGIYKDGTQVGFATITAAAEDAFDASDFYIGQDGNSANYLYAWIDHFRIIKSNIFSAAPVVGLTDTITEPAAAYTDPGNTYAVARYDGYNPSKLLTADFEDLADWCDDAQTNPANFTILSISKATNAIIVTASQHNFKVGDIILFRNIDDNGMVEITDETSANVLKVPDSYTVVIDLDTSGYTTFTGGQTKMLHHFEGSDGDTEAFDSSTQGHNIDSIYGFKGSAEIDTAQYKFGASSVYIEDLLATDELRVSSSTDFNIFADVTETWTVEGWIKQDSQQTFYLFHIFDANDYWEIKVIDSTGVRFRNVVGGVTKVDCNDAGGNSHCEDANWHHIAGIRVGADVGIYVDGTLYAYDTMVAGDEGDTSGDHLKIGSSQLDGWVDEVRIFQGNPYGAAPDAGLTDTITPPASPLTIPDTPTIEKYQPRFAFNGGFDTETNMWEAALRVCELCRCVPFWDGDTIRLAIDKSGTSVYAFTMGNIIKDSFQQKFIPTAERAGEIEVHYRDASQDYERQPFTLVNDSIGNTTNKIRLDLFGVTDTDMANRLADFKLLQNLNIKQMAVWQADIDAIACTIGDIVDVQHDVTNYGSIGSGDDPYTGGGRVVSATNTTNAVITIDGEIYFDDADWQGGSTAYKLLLKTSDDSAPESKTIIGVTQSSVAGGTYDITVSGAYTATPGRDDIWAAGASAYETKKYRIINMRRTSEQKVEFTGVEYNSAIYAND